MGGVAAAAAGALGDDGESGAPCTAPPFVTGAVATPGVIAAVFAPGGATRSS